MKQIILGGKRILTGEGALSCLAETDFERTLIVTGGGSMIRTGVIEEAKGYLTEKGGQVRVHSGIGADPTMQEVEKGLAVMREYKPDAVVAIGGGSAMDCAKIMLLFYEFPWLNFDNVLEKIAEGAVPEERKTALICVPSTSGTGSEVTKGGVITDPQRQLKLPIMTECLRPDAAVLDVRLPMTMPAKLAAETGMDALTHALEAYINHNLDDFDEALCGAAAAGIMKWLPISCLEGDRTAREKVHHYQCMAGIGFANVGLGMVHGIAHAYGAAFHLSHGLANAVILPYALDFNRKDERAAAKLDELSRRVGCEDLAEAVRQMKRRLGIPECFRQVLDEKSFLEKQEMVAEHAMLGATRVNPVKIEQDTMRKLVKTVYYGREF